MTKFNFLTFVSKLKKKLDKLIPVKKRSIYTIEIHLFVCKDYNHNQNERVAFFKCFQGS